MCLTDREEGLFVCFRLLMWCVQRGIAISNQLFSFWFDKLGWQRRPLASSVFITDNSVANIYYFLSPRPEVLYYFWLQDVWSTREPFSLWQWIKNWEFTKYLLISDFITDITLLLIFITFYLRGPNYDFTSGCWDVNIWFWSTFLLQIFHENSYC